MISLKPKNRIGKRHSKVEETSQQGKFPYISFVTQPQKASRVTVVVPTNATTFVKHYLHPYQLHSDNQYQRTH